MSSPVIEKRNSQNEENTAMLEIKDKYLIVSNGNKDESACENLEQFTNSTSLPGYFTGESFSSKKGVLNQLLVTAAVVLLGSCAGPPIGYSAVALPQLYQENGSMAIDLEMGSWIASVHSLATPLGSLASGPLMERFGRRSAMQISTIPMAAGWIVITTSSSIAAMLVGRVLCGFSTGMLGPIGQVYLGEISEPRLRGFICSVTMSAYSFGILLVYILGATMTWRMAAAVLIALPVVSLLVISLTPESPIWLLKKKKIEQATKSFNCLRGGNDVAHKEIRHLVLKMEKEEKPTAKDSFFAVMKQPSVLKPFIISNVFNVFIVLSGTFMIMFYAVDIIRDSAGNDVDSMLTANITAVVRSLATVLSCYLFHVVERRPYALFSGIGSCISMMVLGIYLSCTLGRVKSETDFWITVTCLVIYIITNTGLFMMGAVLVSELLSTKVRGMHGSYIFMILNLTIFILAKLYPSIKTNIGDHGMFIFFGIASFIMSIFIFFILPETKNKSLIQIEMYFQGSNYLWMKRDKSEIEGLK